MSDYHPLPSPDPPPPIAARHTVTSCDVTHSASDAHIWWCRGKAAQEGEGGGRGQVDVCGTLIVCELEDHVQF